MRLKKIVDMRPWGKFEQFTLNEKCSVKLIHIKKGKRLSYQYHKLRSEFWRVISGNVLVTINGKKKRLGKGDEVEVPLGAKHRIEGVTDATVLEISQGKFNEKDVVRIDDDYGRA